MLETVTKGFRAAKNRFQGKAEITPELVDESLRDIRVALLEADVAFDVVKKFVANVRLKATGETVKVAGTDKHGKKLKVSPADHFVKICHDELEALMGPVDTSLVLKPKGQVTGIMMVGLQGSGKTTTTGKLATKLLKEGRKVLLVAADVYRPAAVDQLQVLGAVDSSFAVVCHGEPEGRTPLDGRCHLAIDEPLGEELVQPVVSRCLPKTQSGSHLGRRARPVGCEIDEDPEVCGRNRFFHNWFASYGGGGLFPSRRWRRASASNQGVPPVCWVPRATDWCPVFIR